MIALACVLAIVAVGLLRLSWSRSTRSHFLNAAAWATLLASVIAGWTGAGAWGVTVAALVAMGAACLLLVQAAATAPAASAKASNRRVGMLPEGREPLNLARRVTTFVLVVVAAYLAAMGVGLACREMLLIAGVSETNANALALFVVPLAWTGFATTVLMTSDRRRQLTFLIAGMLLAIPTFTSGSMA